MSYDYEIEKTPAQWRQELTPEQFRVLREYGTEAPHSSPLADEKQPGVYHCAACGLALFPSTTKYDSGTGWPSFWAPVGQSVGTSLDRTLFFFTRTEVHCRRCGSHLGHVFPDGPEPTGMRYCINGVALRFVPGDYELPDWEGGVQAGH